MKNIKNVLFTLAILLSLVNVVKTLASNVLRLEYSKNKSWWVTYVDQNGKEYSMDGFFEHFPGKWLEKDGTSANSVCEIISQWTIMPDQIKDFSKDNPVLDLIPVSAIYIDGEGRMDKAMRDTLYSDGQLRTFKETFKEKTQEHRGYYLYDVCFDTIYVHQIITEEISPNPKILATLTLNNPKGEAIQRRTKPHEDIGFKFV